ncbi:MAG: hypothetical protein IKH48_02380 [Prevotella sp.]|nr:hypothetical protein [Prevotella sp.]
MHRFNKQRLFYKLKSKEKMKKVMFMFAAAAMFAACGNTQKPVEQVEEQVEEAVVVDTTLNAADTAAVLAELGVASVEEANADTLQVKLDAILAGKFEAFEKAQAEAAAATEEATEGAAEEATAPTEE